MFSAVKRPEVRTRFTIPQAEKQQIVPDVDVELNPKLTNWLAMHVVPLKFSKKLRIL